MKRFLGEDITDPMTGIVVGTTDSVLTEGARWVQWAETAATDPGLNWSTKQGNTTYNLQQFWTLKAANYDSDPTAWDRLDLKAQKAWAALSNIGLLMDNPPGQQTYADQAQQAIANAKIIALRLGDVSGAALLDKRAAESVQSAEYAKKHGVDDSYLAAVKASTANLLATSFLGIPWWAWAIGAVGLYLVVVKR